MDENGRAVSKHEEERKGMHIWKCKIGTVYTEIEIAPSVDTANLLAAVGVMRHHFRPITPLAGKLAGSILFASCVGFENGQCQSSTS